MKKKRRGKGKKKVKDTRSPYERAMERYLKRYRRIEEKEKEKIRKKFERYMR